MEAEDEHKANKKEKKRLTIWRQRRAAGVARSSGRRWPRRRTGPSAPVRWPRRTPTSASTSTPAVQAVSSSIDQRLLSIFGSLVCFVLGFLFVLREGSVELPEWRPGNAARSIRCGRGRPDGSSGAARRNWPCRPSRPPSACRRGRRARSTCRARTSPPGTSPARSTFRVNHENSVELGKTRSISIEFNPTR